jgi:rhodanese-related sulfurtransferase
VNYAGFVACNVMEGRIKQCFWNEIDDLAKGPKNCLVDVRTEREFGQGHIEGSMNIPVDDIRRRMDEIPKDRRVVLICQSALRSYIAARILEQNGYDCCHLSGGWRLYASVFNDRQVGSPEDYPCGLKK